MKFTYHGPEIAIEIFGTIFPRGQAVEVSDAGAIAKLKTHPEFQDKPAPASAPHKGDKK